MNGKLSPGIVAAILGVAALVIVAIAWKTLFTPPPGPDESVTRLTRSDMMRQRQAGPPPGPPMPDATRRPGMGQ